MKRISKLLSVFWLAIFWVSIPAYALDMLKFDRSFGGKGSGKGGFGKNVKFAFDQEGNIYVSDADTKMIQKLSADGKPILQIPEDPKINPLFNKPGDLVVDSLGNIYVSDFAASYVKASENPRLYIYSPCVHKFSPKGEKLNTYFLDKVDARPKTVLPARVIVDEEGRYALAIQPEGYDRPILVEIDKNQNNQNIYMLDVKYSVVYKKSPDGSEILKFGKYGSSDGEFDDASDMVLDKNGDLFIADKGNNRIVKFDSGGKFLLNFGKEGVGSGELTNPVNLVAAQNGEIWVKDSSQFERIFLPSGAVVVSFLAFEEFPRSMFLDIPQTQATEIEQLKERLRLLEEAIENSKDEEDKEARKREREIALIRTALSYTVMEKISRFSPSGAYLGKIIYKIDKRDPELNDLKFIALDSMGGVYLRDESDLTVRRYKVQGFGVKMSHLDLMLSTRAQRQVDNFLEDYEDIDSKADVENEEDIVSLRGRLMLNYDLSERWNLFVKNSSVYGERDSNYITPPKLEDSFLYGDQGVDNLLSANLRFITDPNPYKYKEVNIYALRVDGYTKFDSNSRFADVSQRRAEREGDSSGSVFGLDWDISKYANLALEYYKFNPIHTSRNFTSKFYDVSGDLYEVFRSRNNSSVGAIELNIKF